MYTKHYNLKIKPFQLSSDTGFIWLGEKHKEALATLRYGILDNKGFLLLTGDVGTGKTTLINALIASLNNDVIYASVPDPSLEKLDFFNYIAASFGMSGEFESKGKFLASFSRFLHKAYENKKKVLLIIDESQLMTQELLEEIRLLSNIVTKDSSPLLNIFFVGQYEFNEIIRRPENRAVAQRLTLNYYIEPLTIEETGEYIQHRLRIAGTKEKLFNASAVKAIYNFSEGFPRKINVICDHCLMSGYAEDQKIITSSIVKESAKDLQVPERKREKKQESQFIAQQPDTLMSVSPEKAYDQSAQAQFSQQGKANKTSLTWPTSGLLFIMVVLISFGFIFLYLTNTTYKEALTYFASIREKIDMSTLVPSGENIPPGENIQPEPKDKTVLPEKNNISKALPSSETPLPAKANIPVEKNEQTASISGSPGEMNHEAEEISGTGEKGLEAVKPESVPVQAATHSLSPKKDSVEETLENPNLPLPKEPLVIRFKYDSNLFSVADIARMKEFARVLATHPEAIINITGYTDSIGDEGYNRKLSEFRANMVKSFLMGQNLPPEKIRTQGLGNQNPIDRNDTAQGRNMNRRVEISVDSNT
jgi:general secretion pathway protein A